MILVVSKLSQQILKVRLYSISVSSVSDGQEATHTHSKLAVEKNVEQCLLNTLYLLNSNNVCKQRLPELGNYPVCALTTQSGNVE